MNIKSYLGLQYKISSKHFVLALIYFLKYAIIDTVAVILKKKRKLFLIIKCHLKLLK